MIYATPPMTADRRARLAELDDLRATVGREVSNPSLWLGTLRRQVKAASVESSDSIEGYEVPAAEVLRLVAGQQTIDPDDENRMAVACYARAMSCDSLPRE